MRRMFRLGKQASRPTPSLFTPHSVAHAATLGGLAAGGYALYTQKETIEALKEQVGSNKRYTELLYKLIGEKYPCTVRCVEKKLEQGGNGAKEVCPTIAAEQAAEQVASTPRP